MDSLTHIVLGACIGEAIAGKNFGKKAMIGGALAQSIPDIDFISQLWLNKPNDLFAHRGLSHSILFAFFATIIMSILFIKFFHKEPVSWKRWFLLFGLNLFTHIFIDSFNAYGVGWFEPFSHYRISFHILFVADPFFSVWPFLAFLFMIIFRGSNKKRRIACLVGITISVLYVIYALFNKISIDAEARANLKEQGISSNNYFTTPTPFNSMLWFIVAKDKGGYYTGYRSIFDRGKKIDFRYFSQNDLLLTQTKNKSEVNGLLRFAQGYYTIEKWHDTLVFNILRFGQVIGGYDSSQKFAFHYFLDRPGANELVVQRGRFEKWNARTFNSFIERIKGN
ncbi:MAG TPA: metal-dependent hydrolase [Chitinophagaceae bacterium]|nr:metal-dependent hydrolase [Chitinophagaceae bacterium]